MKNLIIALFFLSTVATFSSCKKETNQEPFWTATKKFEFQNTKYVYTNGTAIEVIYIPMWNEATPQQTTIQYYKGVTGGQQSFSNPAAATHFIYMAETNSYAGTYSATTIDITTADGKKEIRANYNGEIKTVGPTTFDYRKIVSLSYDGKTFLPENNESYFIATQNEPGVPVNRLVSDDRNCAFTKCVNGVSTQVNWKRSGENISITAGDVTINGKLTGSKYSTPLIETESGDLYIIQFYTLATNSNQVACSCTMEFNLYKVQTGSHKVKPDAAKFNLIVGNC